MRILAIDPGSEQSAYVIYDADIRLPERWEKLANGELIKLLSNDQGCASLAIEMIASYGMSVGAEVFQTCVWTGRFIERFGNSFQPVYRREVKLHLCADSRAKDSNIRQALIDRYGPGKEKAIGKKASPGPLYGMTRDCWSALAVAVTAAEREA